MANEDRDLRQTSFQKFETKIGEFTFGWRPLSGRTATFFSVDAIVNSDLVPRLVWSNSRSMVWDDGGEFFCQQAAFHAPIDQQ